MDCVEKQLQSIFERRTGINFQKDKKKGALPLLGEELKVPARELLLVYLDIEKELKIKIDEQNILKGEFKTFDRVKDLVCRLVEVACKDD